MCVYYKWYRYCWGKTSLVVEYCLLRPDFRLRCDWHSYNSLLAWASKIKRISLAGFSQSGWLGAGGQPVQLHLIGNVSHGLWCLLGDYLWSSLTPPGSTPSPSNDNNWTKAADTHLSGSIEQVKNCWTAVTIFTYL